MELKDFKVTTLSMCEFPRFVNNVGNMIGILQYEKLMLFYMTFHVTYIAAVEVKGEICTIYHFISWICKVNGG